MSLRNLLLVSIALAAALGAYLLLGGSPTEMSVEVRRDVEREAPTESDAEVELAVTAQGPAELGRRDAVEASAADASMIDHPWAEHLAGVTGRIVEEDGTPVVAIRVGLLEGDLGALLEPEFTAMGHTDLSAGESLTDPEGRFVLRDLRSGRYRVTVVAGRARRQTDVLVPAGGAVDVQFDTTR